jgi:hypothetical protein
VNHRRVLLIVITGCLASSVGYACRNVGESSTEAFSREPTPTELSALDQAEKIRVSQCMQRHGIPYVVVPSAPAPLQRAFPYVIDDIAWARENGLGEQAQSQLMRTRGADPNEEYFRSLPPERRIAVRAALVGDRPVGLSVTLPTGDVVTASDHSCIAEAQRRLYGDLPLWFRARVITSNLQQLYVPKVMADARFQQAVGRWAECMRQAGFQYPSPERLHEALPQITAGRSQVAAHDVEVQLAVAEATCAIKTPLGAVARELDHRYGDAVRNQYRAEIQARRRLQLAALPLAYRVIGTAQPSQVTVTPR